MPDHDDDSRPAWAEQLVRLLDDGFRIPGTQLRFGFDSVLGLLLPVAGDAVGAVGALSLFFLAVQKDVPRVVLLRMAWNVAIDALLGSVPLIGDAFDLVWKANRRNLVLIEENARAPDAPPRPPRMRDRVFVASVLMLVVGLLLLPIVVLGLLVRWALS